VSEPQTKAQLQEALGHSSFITFMGLTVLEADAEHQTVTMHMPMRAEFERGKDSKQWHGGPIAALIDTVGDFALVMMLGRPLPTINFRVDYLRPAIDTALTATARIRRTGRSVGIVDIDVFDDKRQLVAIGRATYSTLSG